MSQIITAKDAFQLMDAATPSAGYWIVLSPRIDEKVRKAASRGHDWTWIRFQSLHHDYVVRRLQELGYRIEERYQGEVELHWGVDSE